MSVDTKKVHEFAKRVDSEGNATYRLVRTNPYISLARGDGVEVLLANGRVHDAAGNPLPADSVPSWIEDEVGKMTPDARLSIGFAREGDQASAEAPSDIVIADLERQLRAANEKITQTAQELEQGYRVLEEPAPAAVEPTPEQEPDDPFTQSPL